MLLGQRLFTVPLALAVLASVAAPAGATNVAVVRAESLESVASDLEQTGLSVDLLPWLQGSLGLPDLSWVDPDRPLAVALPMQGMALGAKGIVAVFPVKDEALAMQVLSGAAGNAEPDEAGMLELELEGGATLVIRPLGETLVVGQTRGLVESLDPLAALEPGDLPPGNLALDLDLEPIAPMILMGLQTARQMVEQQIATPDESGNAPDPETTGAITEIWFQLVQDLLRNTDRIQLSVEVGAEHFVVHKRLIPSGGSTLAGFIDAQQGGLPEIARHVDPAGVEMIMAAQVTYTPAFLEAFRSYLERYVTIMQGLIGMAGKEGDNEWLTSMVGMASLALDKWSDCYRGDMAATIDLSEGGFGMRQVIGASDPDVCRSLFSEINRATAQLPAGPDGRTMITITEDALRYRGVSAQLQETRIPQSGDAGDPSHEILSGWFGGDSIRSYQAVTDQAILSTTGAAAEQELKELIDRLSGKAGPGGLTAATFAPLQIGPGLFFVLDVGAMARAFSELPGSESGKAFPDLPDGAGRVVYGARFGPDVLVIELAVPLAFLDAIGGDASDPTEEPEQAAAISTSYSD